MNNQTGYGGFPPIDIVMKGGGKPHKKGNIIDIATIGHFKPLKTYYHKEVETTNQSEISESKFNSINL